MSKPNKPSYFSALGKGYYSMPKCLEECRELTLQDKAVMRQYLWWLSANEGNPKDPHSNFYRDDGRVAEDAGVSINTAKLARM